MTQGGPARPLTPCPRLDEARAAYRLAGRADLGRRLLEGAADAAVRSRRFGDAAKAQHALAVEALQVRSWWAGRMS